MMTRVNRSNTRACRNRGIAVFLLIGFVSSSLLTASDAAADDSLEQRSQKTYWQELYRGLLTRADALRAKVEVERELYADANRRNYRRGNKRHMHYEAMKEAASDLATVEAELSHIEDDGRRAGALPGWFYQVDLERKAAARRPASSLGPDDEGRNPLYLKDLTSDD